MRGKIIGKKGISHIEVILSFVIFITFVVFLLYTLNPLKFEKRADLYLDILEREIKDYAKSEYVFLSIGLDEARSGCFYFEYPLGNKIIVKNETGNITKSTFDNDMIYINGTGKFFAIYSHSEFVENLPDADLGECIELREDEYIIGLLRNTTIILDVKLNELVDMYNTDYNGLKNVLKFPANRDFGFIIKNTDGSEIMRAMKKQPAKIEISAKEVPIEILYTDIYDDSDIIYKDNNINQSILNIQAW